MEDNNPEKIYYQAGFALEEGNIEEAVSLYQEAAQGGYVKAYLKLGDIFKQSGIRIKQG
jgi:TPR repeat protein